MKKISVLALCLLTALTVLLCSCGSTPEPSPSPPVTDGTAEPSPSPPVTSPVPPPSALADDDAEMLRVMAAGKRFVEELQSGEQPANARDWTMDNAASAFERFYRMDTLRVSGVFVDPGVPGQYMCVISGLDAFNYSRSVKVFYDEAMMWYCPIVEYSARIDAVADDYLGYLKNNDPYGLAAWLLEGEVTPDEEFVAEVKKTTDYYQRWFDFSDTFIRESETTIIDADLSVPEGFRMTVENSAGNTFQITLRCGDGLCFPVLPQ